MKKVNKFLIMLFLILSLIPLKGCGNKKQDYVTLGYAEIELVPSEDMRPLYIAGYKMGKEIEGVLDYQKVKAVYLNYYGSEVLLISIDCIGLSNNYVQKIRKGINVGFPVNVASTHTHAGIDTLGLWGPIAIDGKNDAFMNILLESAIKAGNEAIKNAKRGSLTYGEINTKEILEDSRNPQVYDKNMYQLRFIPDNGEATRIIFYGAHAESLRGDNNLLSADFPGYMSRVIKTKTGDNCIYFNGAIGGLIMTKVFDPNDLVNNMKITGEKLANYALSIKEQEIKNGLLKQVTVKVKIELENTLFMYYKFLGILGNKCSKNVFNSKYYLETEVSILKISTLTFIMVPGEIFPELVYGGSLENPENKLKNPLTIKAISNKYGVEDFIIIGLCNDEIGYIVPPSDFLVNEEYPYIQNKTDQYGENHYEETNSVGPNTAIKLIEALEKAYKKIN